MDFGGLRDIALSLNLSAHGVDVVVTLEGEAGIETRGIWVTTINQDMPGTGDFQRRDPIRVMALSRAELPTVPKGTVIFGPEKAGAEDRYWRVDGTERIEGDHVRVYVLPIADDEV